MRLHLMAIALLTVSATGPLVAGEAATSRPTDAKGTLYPSGRPEPRHDRLGAFPRRRMALWTWRWTPRLGSHVCLVGTGPGSIALSSAAKLRGQLWIRGIDDM